MITTTQQQKVFLMKWSGKVTMDISGTTINQELTKEMFSKIGEIKYIRDAMQFPDIIKNPTYVTSFWKKKC